MVICELYGVNKATIKQQVCNRLSSFYTFYQLISINILYFAMSVLVQKQKSYLDVHEINRNTNTSRTCINNFIFHLTWIKMQCQFFIKFFLKTHIICILQQVWVGRTGISVSRAFSATSLANTYNGRKS